MAQYGGSRGQHGTIVASTRISTSSAATKSCKPVVNFKILISIPAQNLLPTADYKRLMFFPRTEKRDSLNLGRGREVEDSVGGTKFWRGRHKAGRKTAQRKVKFYNQISNTQEFSPPQHSPDHD